MQGMLDGEEPVAYRGRGMLDSGHMQDRGLRDRGLMDSGVLGAHRIHCAARLMPLP